MNGPEILRIVDAIHRDKAIDIEIVFEGIEQAILSAARKHFSEDENVEVQIDRKTGEPALICDGRMLEPELLGDLLGRISAQTAKQVMIQKIREAERDTVYDEFLDLRSQLVSGLVTRIDRGTVIVNLGKIEAILPRSEQIPKENYRVGDRVRAIVLDVRKAGSRVRVILSRTHAEFVRRLFEVEIPEINDRVIEVRSISREAGHRSKVAVSCTDSTIDCVGACVGVRGARIRGIVEELSGERIDIVRWNDSLQVLVPNALQPAEVEDVILCPMLGKVIVLVRDDQLSLAIGRRGQNVRLASKLVGWDINVMTQVSLDEQLDISIEAFSAIPQMTADLSENLVSQGFFTFDDLSVIEPDQLAEIGGLSQEDCDAIIEFADVESIKAEAQEKLAAEQRKQEMYNRDRQPAPSAAPPVAAASAAEGDVVEAGAAEATADPTATDVAASDDTPPAAESTDDTEGKTAAPEAQAEQVQESAEEESAAADATGTDATGTDATGKDAVESVPVAEDQAEETQTAESSDVEADEDVRDAQHTDTAQASSVDESTRSSEA